MKIISKLLNNNISKPQLFGFLCANIIGLTIVLLGIQFYTDINPILSSSNKDGIIKKNFIVVTKKLEKINSDTKFTEDEINKIRNEKFVSKINSFAASKFNVYLNINIFGREFGSKIFFESVSDNFIDIKNEKWKFNENDSYIPIILPRSYLSLYNFGFAESSGMPKLTEDVIKDIPLEIQIVTNKNRQTFKANIIDFSDRINTILVPESFLLWANKKFGDEENNMNNSNKLILELSNPLDSNIIKFFSENNYSIQGDDSAMSKMSFFLNLIIYIVIFIGIVIFLLSFMILMLSIYLLLEKSMDKISTLRLLGYKKSKISIFYTKLIFKLGLISTLLSVILVYFLRAIYINKISLIWDDNIAGDYKTTIIFSIIIFITFLILNIYIIKRKLK